MESNVLFSVEVYLSETTSDRMTLTLEQLKGWRKNRELTNNPWEATQVNVKAPVTITRSTSARELLDYDAQKGADDEVDTKLAWSFA